MIREAKPEEMLRLVPLGKMFMRESAHLVFHSQIFVPNIQGLMLTGVATVLVQEEEERLIGALGWLEFNDFFCGQRTAQELFWFVDPTARGRGIWLLKQFEKRAKQHGCVRLIMTCLADCMAEDLGELYLRLGYKAMEWNFVKMADSRRQT